VTSASGSASELNPDHFPLPAPATAGEGSGSRRLQICSWLHLARRSGASHRAHWESADLPAKQHAGVGPTPTLQAAPGDS
jgi:hypothetical protein